jgi:hypothetical protein
MGTAPCFQIIIMLLRFLAAILRFSAFHTKLSRRFYATKGVNHSWRFLESLRIIDHKFCSSPRTFFNNISMYLKSLQYRHNLLENHSFSCQFFSEILRISKKVWDKADQYVKWLSKIEGPSLN